MILESNSSSHDVSHCLCDITHIQFPTLLGIEIVHDLSHGLFLDRDLLGGREEQAGVGNERAEAKGSGKEEETPREGIDHL